MKTENFHYITICLLFEHEQSVPSAHHDQDKLWEKKCSNKNENEHNVDSLYNQAYRQNDEERKLDDAVSSFSLNTTFKELILAASFGLTSKLSNMKVLELSV